jgi:NAD(P)-dependent dehydrogenase (short-subunit alcohol dehydrogenase family)
MTMSETPVAVVTGSASGIGAAIVERLARERMTLVINYRRSEGEALALRERILPLAPGSLAIQADVSKPAEARRLIDETLARCARIDVLVNNAGPWLVKSAYDTSVEEWQYILENNLSSAFYCSKFALAAMRARRAGQIVNIGSANVELARGAPNLTAYNVAKTGVVVLTRSLARTEGSFGIRVNCVNPGYVEQPALSDEERQRVASAVPLRRVGTAAEVAEAVAFLVSERAAYINGAVLNVHGGLWV